MSWKKTKIGELLSQYKDATQIKHDNFYELVTLSNTGKISLRKTEIGSEIKSSKLYKIKKNSFIYSRLSIHNGAFSLVPKNLDGAFVSDEMPVFNFNEEIIDKDFFIYSIKSSDFNFELNQLIKGVGRVRVKEKDFLNLEIFLPSLNEQKQIAEKLKISEEKQKILQQQINNQKTNLKNLRKQILQDAIEGKLTKEWREQNQNIEPASELLKKIKKEKEKLITEKKIKKEKPLPAIKKNEVPFELPRDWVWVGISEIGLCFTGDSINESVKNLKYKVLKSGLNYIGTKDVGFECSGVNYNTGVVIPFDEAGTDFKIAKKGSIFICIEGGSSGKKIALLDRDVCFGNKLLATYVFSPVSYKYVYFVYQTFFFESEFRNKSKGLRGGVSVNLFKTIKIPLPPLPEQSAIVSKLQALMQKLDEAEKQIEKSLNTSQLLAKTILAEAFKV